MLAGNVSPQVRTMRPLWVSVKRRVSILCSGCRRQGVPPWVYCARFIYKLQVGWTIHENPFINKAVCNRVLSPTQKSLYKQGCMLVCSYVRFQSYTHERARRSGGKKKKRVCTGIYESTFYIYIPPPALVPQGFAAYVQRADFHTRTYTEPAKPCAVRLTARMDSALYIYQNVAPVARFALIVAPVVHIFNPLSNSLRSALYRLSNSLRSELFDDAFRTQRVRHSTGCRT